MIVSGNKNMRANRSEKSSLASSSPRAGRVGRGLRRGAFSIRGHLFSPAPSSIRWRYVFRTMVELVALRRVAPRTAAQHYPLGLRTVSSAAERGAVVAARQPLPLNTYRWRRGSRIVAPLPDTRVLHEARNVSFVFGWFLLVAVSCGAAEPAARSAASEALSDRPSIDLSGQWEFKLDPLDVGRAEKWFESRVPFERMIRVPGAWNAQGVAFDSEKQLHDYEGQRLEEQKPLNKLGTLGVQRESERLFSAYPGPGWYGNERTIPADWNGKVPWLIFGGVHREAEVWVNGQPAGAHHSYLTPFRLDLSRHGKAGERIKIAVRVDARHRKEVDPLMGCLDTLDFLYITWGGLHGRVWLEATEATRMDDVFVAPQLGAETAEIRLTIRGARTRPLAVSAEILDASGAAVVSVNEAITADTTEAVLAARIPNAKLWSPKSPHLYTARVRLLSGNAVIDTRSVRFGMREFKVAGGKFLLNGKPIFLRGYGDDAIFPNTICPPVEKSEFHRRLSIAREYGFNYVRHHSWTPPEEYFEAADELGMMLQPEFPFAYRWDLPTTPEAKRAALEQWETIIRLRRNHPSIVTWCMGNE